MDGGPPAHPAHTPAAPDMPPPRLTLKNVALYLCGNEEAIRELARYKPLPWVGAVLVLTAGIAREYDHIYLLSASARMLLVPFGASLIAAMIVFTGVSNYLLRPLRLPLDRWRFMPAGFRTFLGFFWLTAPLAWLYALPVERWCTPGHAAAANLTLLGIVAAWRVLLISRVVSVLYGVPLWPCLATVLLPCSAIVCAVGFLAPMFLVPFMSGIPVAVSEEQDVVLVASGYVFFAAGAVFLGTLITRGRLRKPATRPTETAASGPFPWVGLAATLIVCGVLAVGPQREQQKYETVARLALYRKYGAAFDYMAAQGPQAFPPTRRLPPSPYANATRHTVDDAILALTPHHPVWLQDTYLAYLGAQVSTDSHGRHSPLTSTQYIADSVALLEHVGTLHNSLKWAKDYAPALLAGTPDYEELGSAESERREKYLFTLRALGLQEEDLQAAVREQPWLELPPEWSAIEYRTTRGQAPHETSGILDQTASAPPSPELVLDQREYGLRVQEASAEMCDVLGLPPSTRGVLVVQVTPNGPADSAGLRRGDIIRRTHPNYYVDMHKLPSLATYEKVFTDYAKTPIERAQLLVQRGTRLGRIQIAPDWSLRPREE